MIDYTVQGLFLYTPPRHRTPQLCRKIWVLEKLNWVLAKFDLSFGNFDLSFGNLSWDVKFSVMFYGRFCCKLRFYGKNAWYLSFFCPCSCMVFLVSPQGVVKSEFWTNWTEFWQKFDLSFGILVIWVLASVYKKKPCYILNVPLSILWTYPLHCLVWCRMTSGSCPTSQTASRPCWSRGGSALGGN